MLSLLKSIFSLHVTINLFSVVGYHLWNLPYLSVFRRVSQLPTWQLVDHIHSYSSYHRDRSSSSMLSKSKTTSSWFFNATLFCFVLLIHNELCHFCSSGVNRWSSNSFSHWSYCCNNSSHHNICFFFSGSYLDLDWYTHNSGTCCNSIEFNALGFLFWWINYRICCDCYNNIWYLLGNNNKDDNWRWICRISSWHSNTCISFPVYLHNEDFLIHFIDIRSRRWQKMIFIQFI